MSNQINQVVNIPLTQIVANRYQPRTVFAEIELQELSKSIQQHGLLQPIVLRQVTNDMYEIIAGERRYRATQLAGLDTVPAIIKDMTVSDAAVLALIENVQREDLTAIEEAKSFEKLMDLLNKTQSEIAEMVSISQSAVANKLRLLQLTIETQQAIENKVLSERHGRALLRIKDKIEQNQILNLILDRNLTVADTEKYIDAFLTSKDESSNNDTYTVSYNVAKETKLAVNTINKAVKTIQEFGMEILFEQTENDDEYMIQIVIPKIMVEKEEKPQQFAHEKIAFSEEKLATAVQPDVITPMELPTMETKDTEEEQSDTKPIILDLDLTAETIISPEILSMLENEDKKDQ